MINLTEKYNPFAGYHASMYGGQAAASGTKGFQQGTKFQQDSQAAYQDAQLKREAIEKAKVSTLAMQDVYRDYGGIPPEQLTAEQQTTQRIQQVEAKQKATENKYVGKEGRQAITALVRPNNTKDRETQLASTIQIMKDNPEVAQTLGIQNLASADVVRVGNAKQTEQVLEFYNNIYSTDHTTQNTDEVTLAQIVNQYPAVVIDGAVVDLIGLQMAMGGATSMGVNEKKNYEADMEKMGDIHYASNTALSPTQVNDIEKKRADKKSATELVKSYISKAESGGDTKAKNPNSSAYGEFQVIDSTLRNKARELGITEEQGKSEVGQQLVMDSLMEDYKATLDANQLSPTNENYYALHQLGEPVGVKYLKGNIDNSVLQGMRAQFPKGAKFKSDAELVDAWETRFRGTSGSAQLKIREELASNERIKPSRLAVLQSLAGVAVTRDKLDSPTALMRNYDFMQKHGVKQPTKKMEKPSAASTTTMFKAMQERDDLVEKRDALPTGSEAYNTIDNQVKQYDSYIPKLGDTAYGVDQPRKEQKTESIIKYKFDPEKANPAVDDKQESRSRNDSKIYDETMKKEVKSLQEASLLGEQLGLLRTQMKNPKVRSGMLDTLVNDITSVLPDWAAKTSDEQAAATQGMNQMSATILKMMSGASATDQEFMRTQLQVVGNDNMQESDRVQALENYIERYNMSMETRANRLGEYLPVTAREVLDGMIKSQPSAPKPSANEINELWGVVS